jgi:predicted acylesterase/phospholipase RssA
MLVPHRIYLSGGGMCGIGHVGALLELSKHLSLKAVKEWMGVSAGSLIAMCLCIGFTLEELYDVSVRFDFTNIKEYDSVPGWLLHFGIDTGERLHKLIEACLHVKNLSSDLTFKDCFEKFGKSLRVVATDLNDAKSITFCPKLSPDYRIADAVRASMSYPYYFQPFICPETGHHLSDGGVISNYPLFVLPKEEHSRTLSILIRTIVEKEPDLNQTSLEELISRPIKIVLTERTNIEARFYDSKCIQVQLGNLNILEFSFDEDTKKFIVEKGREAVINYFKSCPRPERRYSVG